MPINGPTGPAFYSLLASRSHVRRHARSCKQVSVLSPEASGHRARLCVLVYLINRKCRGASLSLSRVKCSTSVYGLLCGSQRISRGREREREKKALVHAGIFFERGLPRWRESTLSAFMVLNAWHTKSFDVSFFFFFFCVQLQHGTGESIIIDVIFERGKSVRESSNTCTREYGWYWLVEEIYGDKIA